MNLVRVFIESVKSLVNFILNLANFYFVNHVRAVWIQWIAMKLCSGSKTLCSTCCWNYSLCLMNLGFDWLKPESSPMEEEKNGTATHGWQCECFQPLALEEMALFVYLWEDQHYLWDPADRHSCGVHCWGSQLQMDNRLHVSCVSMCVCICVQPAERSLGLSLHLINKSVKKWSMVLWTVWTIFGNLKVHLTTEAQFRNEV